MSKLLCLCTALLLAVAGSAQVYHLQDLTTKQIEALDRKNTYVLLPGGILEEHGPYLPSFTDGYLNLALTDSIAKTIAKRKGMQVLVFPLIPLGNGGANEIPRKYSFPGTYSVRANTLRSLLMDMASELGDQGFRNILVIHMHGAPNHNNAIDQAAAYFNDTYHGHMINVWNMTFRIDARVLTPEQREREGFTVHGGTIEHSMLYYLKPGLRNAAVRTAAPFRAAGPSDLLRVGSDSTWPGYWGAPQMATPDLGRQTWNKVIAGIRAQVNQLLDGTYDFKQPTYYELMEQDPAQKAVDADAALHDAEKAAKQQAWLKSKGFAEQAP